MRIKQHPILDFEPKRPIHFRYNHQEVIGYEGDTIAAALHAAGIKVLSFSLVSKRPRGFYCAIGNCGSCHMTVNGIPNVKTCLTLLEDGMDVISLEAKVE